jgi:hypothetical protein
VRKGSRVPRMSSRKAHNRDEAGRDPARGIVGDGRTIGMLTVACAAITLVVTIALLLGQNHEGVASARHGPTPRVGHRHRKHARLPAPMPRAIVTIGMAAKATPVPPSYFGLSTEYWTLPLYERHLALFERVLSLLRVRGDAPQILRIGGDSADRTFWVPRDRRMPRWAFKLTPALVDRTAELVRHAGVRLILDLNLITDSSRAAVRWARAAETRLPRGSIVGFEVGNEPDLYAQWFWLGSIGRARMVGGPLPRVLSAAGYKQSFRAYAHAIERIAPSVPLLGPALANPLRHRAWLAALLAGPHRGLRIVSVHRYPYSACARRRRSPAYPTVARLLSERATAGLAATVSNAVWLAHRAGLELRLTEMNSVTCGGRRGVSNTFATALWAPDALFEMLRTGVDGVNIHLRANTINAPFALTKQGMVVRPLMYGLLLFARTLGPAPQLVRVQLHMQRGLHLKAWAVRLAGRVLHVLVVNKGNRAARVYLRIPGSGPASVQRLLAPSATARSGVTLAGQQLDGAGRWIGARSVETIPRAANGYAVTLPAVSAALVGVRVTRPEIASVRGGPPAAAGPRPARASRSRPSSRRTAARRPSRRASPSP